MTVVRRALTSRMRVVVALLGSLLVTVPANGAPRTDTKTVTIRVVSVTVGSRFIVDKAPKGVRNVGDTVWTTSNLRNERPQFGKSKGALVGSKVAIYTVVSPSVGTVKETTTLPDGKIRSSDRRAYDGCCGTTSQVTGGTGVFAEARGTVHTEQLTRERHLKIYRLQLR